MHTGVWEWSVIWCPLDGRFGKQLKKEYKIGDQAPTDSVELAQYEGNAKYLNSILSGLTNSVFTKVMRCKTAKQAWDNLKMIYEGESKVKESKIQKYKGTLRALKLNKNKILGNTF